MKSISTAKVPAINLDYINLNTLVRSPKNAAIVQHFSRSEKARERKKAGKRERTGATGDEDDRDADESFDSRGRSQRGGAVVVLFATDSFPGSAAAEQELASGKRRGYGLVGFAVVCRRLRRVCHCYTKQCERSCNAK